MTEGAFQRLAIARRPVLGRHRVFLFFFQAEDGIRDLTVTGVQTCALPILRLMWTNVIGSGGAKGLLWLERREGYASVLFENEPIRSRDVMMVFSHGGLNAADRKSVV